MKKRPAILILAIFLLTSFGIIFFLSKARGPEKVCFGKNCFFVEIAKNEYELKRGLMFRERLLKNRGMLFIFPQNGNYPFWMKNTKIPLDIIWIDEEKRVVFIEKNAQPCPENFCPQIDPKIPARYALEINAGLCDVIGLEIQSKINFSGIDY